MMDTRDRMEELGEHKRHNGDDSHDGKFLLNDYVTKEELKSGIYYYVLESNNLIQTKKLVIQ